jgi:TolB-like protein/DNA-binding winged helix-turn-helix (wHTH) protein/Tfp pilus assembly protein PilF
MSEAQSTYIIDDVATFRLGACEIDPSTCRVHNGSDVVKLPPQAMSVLTYLATRPMRVISRDEIENIVWEGRTVGYDTLTGTMFKLRKALGDDPKHPEIIETIPKRGYRLLIAPEPLEERPDLSDCPGVQAHGPTLANWSSANAPSPNADFQPFKRWVGRADGNVYRLLALPILLILVLVAIATWWRIAGPINRPVDGQGRARNSIVILPFTTMGGTEKNDYFADGLTDDLTTSLAKQRGLFVIARDSAFFYKGQDISDADIGRRLKVRYVLRGSIQRQGRDLRINSRLTDLDSGQHVWADHFDGRPTNLFTLQDELVGKIVNSITSRIAPTAGQSALVARTKSPEAYDAFLAGRQHFYLYLNKRENEKARALFQQALQFDPNFALAHIMLAWTHVFDAMNGWSKNRDASLDRAMTVANRGIALEKNIPLAYFVTGLVFRERKEYVKALVEAEKAIALDPNYANGHVLVASLLFYAGRPDESVARIKKAMRLNPHHPFNYAFHLGQAYYALERYDEAIKALEGGIATNPASERLHLWLAASYAQAGRIDDAQWEAEQIRVLNPEFNLSAVSEAFPFKDRAISERFLNSLRKAGL